MPYSVFYIFGIDECCWDYVEKQMFNIIQPTVKNNKWLIHRTVEILDFGFFRVLENLGVYVVIADNMSTTRIMVHN